MEETAMPESTRFVLLKPELQVTLSLSHNPIPVIDGMVKVDALLEINPMIPQGNSAPIDFCFVADCSGSMNQRASRTTNMRKMDAVRIALVNMVAKMSPSDRIRVIGFSDTAFEILPWTLIGTADLESVSQILYAGLQSRSNTYFSDALKMSLEDGLGTHGSPTVVLLTDGQSSDRITDHSFMVSFADNLREKKIPLIIYGTGDDYNLNLLSQLAVRAGNGSLMYHVMSVEDLEAHLTGEMAFRHGYCLESVYISVFSRRAKFSDVYRFVPQEHQLVARTAEQTEHNDGGSYLLIRGNGFQNACGAIDHIRGQKFLFHLEIPLVSFREDRLLNLVVSGNKPNGPRFSYGMNFPATCTEVASTQTINPEVNKYKKMLEATKAVKAGDIARGAEIYESLGHHDLARTLVQMSQVNDSFEATTRGTVSLAGSALSTILQACQVREQGSES